METILPGLTNARNIHPLFVHFPIAFWLGAFAFWAIGLIWRTERVHAFARGLLYLGTLTAIATGATGLWAEEDLGHDSPGHEYVHVHRNWMFATAAAAILATGWAFYARKVATRRDRWGIFAMLGVTCVLLVLGTDRGGYLVYEHGIGTNVGPGAAQEGEPDEHEHDHEHEEPAVEASPAD